MVWWKKKHVNACAGEGSRGWDVPRRFAAFQELEIEDPICVPESLICEGKKFRRAFVHVRFQ